MGSVAAVGSTLSHASSAFHCRQEGVEWRGGVGEKRKMPSLPPPLEPAPETDEWGEECGRGVGERECVFVCWEKRGVEWGDGRERGLENKNLHAGELRARDAKIPLF
uniref:Uncharacterized protein n=1 Tax=Oryza sativa subsp. japonica TaxID=39947 RepID=Q67VH3_ORYSJ|nr:hypothetical protein [Oryza sativa Japonica Group]